MNERAKALVFELEKLADKTFRSMPYRPLIRDCDQITDADALEVGRIYRLNRIIMGSLMKERWLCASTVWLDEFGKLSVALIHWPGLLNGRKIQLCEVGIVAGTDGKWNDNAWMVWTDQFVSLVEVDLIIKTMHWRGPGHNPLRFDGGFE